MQGPEHEDLRRDYNLYFRQGPIVMMEVLRDVEPERVEAAVATRLGEWRCSADNTRILRVEPSQDSVYLPSFRRELDPGGRPLDRTSPEGLLRRALAAAWVAAASTYWSSVHERDGRPYALHAFDGPLRVQAGSIAGELTCLHPALTSPANDVFPVIGEARLDMGRTSLVLEFDREISREIADGWHCVSDAPRRRTPDDFPSTGWFVVE